MSGQNVGYTSGIYHEHDVASYIFESVVIKTDDTHGSLGTRRRSSIILFGTGRKECVFGTVSSRIQEQVSCLL